MRNSRSRSVHVSDCFDSDKQNIRGFLKHFVVKTIGIRKRRFDRSTVIIKQSEDKNLHKY